MATSKRVFTFEKSSLRKVLNRLNLKLRLFGCFSLALLITFSPTIKEAWQNGRKIERRTEWLRTRVTDPNAEEFSKLDIEVPPPGSLQTQPVVDVAEETKKLFDPKTILGPRK